MAALQLYNSLTRQLEPFAGPRDGETVRIYTCGPTVYNYQHIGNMRAFLFADTLGRVLRWNGYATRHIINITDVGHLTSDADAGADKMEQAAAAQAKSIWDIAAHYTDAFKRDVARLNIEPPTEWTVATDHIPQMIAFAKTIEKNCYQLESGLYFDTSKVPNYGSLARQVSDEGESRIDPVSGKRHPQDFAIWRTSPPGENRQMEWGSPWGRGAPGWHLECSVMSLEHLGHPFDIHTGGIDHREIHHPNEIAQNQAFCGCADSGAAVWMHNNFLIDRRGKMSKSSGDFLTLQTLVDRGVHPLAYRLMCLQAHYRSELEFTWENLFAAETRLIRLLLSVDALRANRTANSIPPESKHALALLEAFGVALSDDLNTPKALPLLESALEDRRIPPGERLGLIERFDEATGLRISSLSRIDLRIRPNDAKLTEAQVEQLMTERKTARAEKDYARSDAIRDDLKQFGIHVMDGGASRIEWDWIIEQ